MESEIQAMQTEQITPEVQVIQNGLTPKPEIQKAEKRKNRAKRLFLIIGIPCGIGLAFLCTQLWIYFSTAKSSIESSKNSISQNQESGKYEISGQGGVISKYRTIDNYHFSKIDENNEGYYNYGEDKSLTLTTVQYKRLKKAYKIKDYIIFDFTFSNGKLTNRKILSKKTNEDLGNLNKINRESIIGGDNIIYTNDHITGEEFDVNEEVLYNNSNKTLTLIITNIWGNEEEVKLKKGEIYGNDNFGGVTVKIK